MEMNIQKFLAFITTIQYGSFTKAAEILNYSQSGISRMIHDLELEWGVSLLERRRSGVRPTSAGISLLPYAQSICHEYQKLQMHVEQMHGLQSGLIRIGTFSSVATHWIPNIIQAFQKQYPNVDYELLLGDYTEIEAWILEGRVDCGFLRLPTQPQLDTIFLEKDKLLVILPEDHPFSESERFPVKALDGTPFMLLEKGAKAEIAEIFEHHHIQPKVQLTTWDDYAIMSMVESGLGISILPELILKRSPYRIIAKELEMPAYRNIGLAMKSKQSAPLVVKTFVEYIEYRNTRSI